MCQPGWEGVWGRMDTCICMAKSLCCSPETITTLLISYTPIQNTKFKVWGKEGKKKKQMVMSDVPLRRRARNAVQSCVQPTGLMIGSMPSA